MRIIISIALIVLLHGCTTSVPVKPKEPIQGYVELDKEALFKLKDKRPENIKFRNEGSINQLSCDLGIISFEDSITIPGRISYLESRLQQEASNLGLDGEEIEIYKFSATVNSQIFMRSRSKNISFSSEPDTLVAQEVFNSFISQYECWKQEEEIGGYNLSLNPQLQIVGVVDFSAKVKGQIYDFKEVFVPGKGEMDLPIIETTIYRATNTFIKKLRTH